jgi:iron complex outermembrane recepter protein
LNLSAQQTIPLRNGAKLVGALRGHFQTETLTGLEFLPDEFQRRYWLADAQLTYAPANDRYSVGVFVNNMFDETVIANTFPTSFAFFRSSSLRPPRTFGLRAQMHF